jgi:serine protease Do
MHRLAAFGLMLVSATSVVGAEPSPNSPRMTPVVKAVKRVRPAVVNLHSQKTAPGSASLAGAMANSGRMSGMGTGVIVDPRGYIVTNHHVVEDVTNLRATLMDGSVYPAEIVARDQATDLALIAIRTSQPLAAMPLGDSADVMIGETVIAVGNAFGYEHTTTVGYVSELHRDVRLSDEQSYKDLIQTDAAINPGNSGGPLVNLDGEMIGLNVAIRAGAQNIGFAITTNEVKRVLARLLSVQRLRRTYHGLGCQTADGEDGRRGKVIVKRVDAAGPGDAAGLKIGDRLLAVDENAVDAAFDLERFLLDKRAGEQSRIRFLRDGAERAATLTIGVAPVRSTEPAGVVWRRTGMRLSEAPVAVSEVRRTSSASMLNGGLRVQEVAPHSPADTAGLKSGDIFVGIEDRETLTLEHVLVMLKQAGGRDHSRFKFWLVREGKLHYGTMDLLADD